MRGKAREVKCMFQADLLQDKVILVTGGGTGLGRGTRDGEAACEPYPLQIGSE